MDISEQTVENNSENMQENPGNRSAVSPIFIGWVCSGVFDWIGGWNEKKDILLYLCSGSNYLGGGCPGVLQVP